MSSQLTGVSIVCSTFVQVRIKENFEAPLHRSLWPVTSGFTPQRAITMENVSVWWRIHVADIYMQKNAPHIFHQPQKVTKNTMNVKVIYRMNLYITDLFKSSGLWNPCYSSRLISFTVAHAERSLCETNNYLKLESTSGYISSFVAKDTGCGSPNTPWIIQVEPGQRINLTLWDFDVQKDTVPILSVCHHRYATVRERALNRSMSICGGIARETHVYLSMSNSLEVSLLTTLNDGQFLIFFESKYTK